MTTVHRESTKVSYGRLLTWAFVAVFLISGLYSVVAQGPRPRPQTWVDCERFDGVVTPATFDPEAGPFDELYHGIVTDVPVMTADGFKDGVPLISESKPGDRDYNGGRWHLNVLKSTVPVDRYADACSVEDLDLDDFVPTDNYFECPLLPRRGGGPKVITVR